MAKADGGAVYPLDLLANAVLHRSANLVRGYSLLVEQRNFICAAPLLRLQIDNCLRFYAAFIVADAHDFAEKVFKGVRVSKMKDRTGSLMTDAYLAKKLSRKHPWILRVYDRTSGYVHLSDTHIFNTFSPPTPGDLKETKQQIVVGPGDCFAGDALYEEATAAFIEATRLLFEHLVGWVKTKDRPRRA